jgi:hypothetical protein
MLSSEQRRLQTVTGIGIALWRAGIGMRGSWRVARRSSFLVWQQQSRRLPLSLADVSVDPFPQQVGVAAVAGHPDSRHSRTQHSMNKTDITPLCRGPAREAGPVPAPAVKRKPTVGRPAQSRDATKERAVGSGEPPKKCSGSPNTHGRRSHLARPCFARKTPGSVWRSNSDVPHRSGARTCSRRWPRSASASSRGRSAACPVRPEPGTT